jgi:hypothetical protein
MLYILLHYIFYKVHINIRNCIDIIRRSDAMERDFSEFQNTYNFNNPNMQSGFQQGFSAEMSDMYKDPMFNPIMQYEQAFSYYKYLCMQMDYKIKCKEYEKLCNNNSNSSAES